MKRFVFTLLVGVFLLGGVAPAQDKGKDKGKEKEKDKYKGKLVLQWRGQSFFLIRTPKGTRIAIDPHNIPAYGRVVGGIKADVVFMSHNHNDHNQLIVIDNFKDNLKGKGKEKEKEKGKEKGKEKDKIKEAVVIPGYVVKGKKTDWNLVKGTFEDVKYRTVGVYHDNMEGLMYGKNTIFILVIDGWRIVHLGDLGHELTKEQLTEIKKDGPIDVLMIPVGGIYSLNGREAKKVVKQLEPREYIIPMHFGTPVFDDLLTPAEFLEGQPKESIRRQDITKTSSRLVLDRTDKRARPQIVILHYGD